MSRREKFKVALDFAAIVLIALETLTILFGGLGGVLGRDQASVNLSFFLLAMTFSGIVLIVVSGLLTFSSKISKRDFMTELTHIIGSFAGFFILNLIVPPAVPFAFNLSLASSGKFISVIIAVPEELLFDGWAAPWLANRTGSLFMGALLKAALGTTYHLFVYSTQPSALLIVFGAFFIAGVAALKTRRLSTVMAVHLGNNFLSVYG